MDNINNNHPKKELEYRPFPLLKPGREFERAMEQDAGLFPDEKTGKLTLYEDYRRYIFYIDQFVQDIIKSDDPGFTLIYPKTPSYRPRLDGSRFIKAMYKLFCKFRRAESEKLRFSEFVQLYFDIISELNLMDVFFMNPESRVIDFEPHYKLPGSEESMDTVLFGDLFNKVINRIREVAASNEFKKRINRRNARSMENYRRACQYIDSLFEVYSRLLVLRVDFYYRSEFAHKVTIEKAQADREHFLNNMRNNQLFNSVVGSLWKLEDGQKRGLHFHFIFFLNGSYSENDYYLADKFGTYWSEVVTKDRGRFYSCHTSTSSYKSRGIGIINHYEDDKRANLKGALLDYITKTDQYVRIKGCRVFGRGETPKRTTSKNGNFIGRPRKYAS